MPSVPCPACDERMEIEADWYGRKVACPSCDKQFVVRRPGSDDDDEPDDRPKRRRAYDDDDEDDDRPKKKKKKRPRPMGRGTRQLLVAAVIGGGILLCCLGCFGWGAFQFFGPMDYSRPWVSVANPDNSFSAQFPRSPDSDTDPNEVIGGQGKTYTLAEDGVKDAAFVFASLDDSHLSFDDAYRAEVDNIMMEVKSDGAKLKEERAITVAGCPGKEAVIVAGPTKVVFRLIDASQGGRRRYLIVMAGGRNVSDADRNKFLDSLKRGP